jgi:hypothetical protein
MDKILQSASTGEIMVTNDGATILKSIALDNAGEFISSNLLVFSYGSGAWSLGSCLKSRQKETSRRLLKTALLLPAVIEVHSIFLY